MNRRNFLTLIPIIIACSNRGNNKKISTNKNLLGRIIDTDSKGEYHLQSNNEGGYVVITTERDYAFLDSLKNAGIDSVDLKSSKINIQYLEKTYKSYFIKK